MKENLVTCCFALWARTGTQEVHFISPFLPVSEVSSVCLIHTQCRREGHAQCIRSDRASVPTTYTKIQTRGAKAREWWGLARSTQHRQNLSEAMTWREGLWRASKQNVPPYVTREYATKWKKKSRKDGVIYWKHRGCQRGTEDQRRAEFNNNESSKAKKTLSQVCWPLIPVLKRWR